MDKSRARIALLKISVGVLIFTNWVFFSFVFATRPTGSESGTLTKLVRLPASIPSQLPSQLPGVFVSVPKPIEPVEMNVFNVPCWDKGFQRGPAISAKWIRLTGRSCQVDVKNESIFVRNLTNGYAATVFPTQGKALTTDFIPLKVGRNEILIRMEQGPGVALESHVTLRRD